MKIVVPVDFSAPAAQAVDYARSMVATPMDLHLVHVLSPPGDRQSAIQVAFQARFRERHPPQVHVKVGDAATEICRLAGELQAELIVIPTSSQPGELRGSVTLQVLREAMCPVLVLHPPNLASEQRISAPWPSPRTRQK